MHRPMNGGARQSVCPGRSLQMHSARIGGWVDEERGPQLRMDPGTRMLRWMQKGPRGGGVT